MAVLSRMWLLSSYFLYVLILVPGNAKAQSAEYQLPDKSANVKARLIADTSAIQAGKPFHLGVELAPEEGWHTYYKDPGDSGMATKIQWSLPNGFVNEPLKWERPARLNEEGIITFGYTGKSLISAEIKPPLDLKAGKPLTFSAKVKWLSCRELCVPGGTDLTITLPISNGACAITLNQEEFARANFDGAVHEINASQTETPKSKFHFADTKITAADGTDKEKGLLFYLTFALIGGVILNLMPCVLPVVAIKIVSLLEYKGACAADMRKLGLAFVGGIISSFLALAWLVIALQSAGHTVGWGFQFQYPPFIIIMCMLVLLFALSLFGLFDISVATVGQAKVEQLACKEGLIGSFFKGVLATILSTPCTAPFLGTALGFAFVQPWWVVLGIFLAVGIGMSSPYLLMMSNPAWIKYLPKPGMWMVKLKEGMGFVLLVTVAWLLSILARQVGIDAVMAITYFLITVTFAAWLASRFVDLTSSVERAIILRALAVAIVLAAAYVFIFTKPALLVTNSNESVVNATPLSSGDSLAWQPFAIDKLESSVNAGKTVLVDCTASWCLTCQVNESTVLNNQAVVERLKKMNVVLLKADWTDQDLTITQFLRKFGRSGVPMYVIFPAKSPDKPILLPEIITVPLMLQKLEEAS